MRRAFRTKFVRDTAVLQLGMVVTMATYLLTSVLLARGLGPHQFGRYALANALYVLVFFIANLGVTTVSVSAYARACGERDPAKKAETLACYVKAFGLMCLCILGVGLCLPVVAEAYYQDREIGRFALLMCLLGPVQLVNGLVLVALQGARQMRDYVLYDNACGLLRVLVLVCALLDGRGLEGVIVAQILAGGIASLLGLRMYRVVRRENPVDGPPPLFEVLRRVPGAPMKELFATSTQLAFSKNGGEMLRSLAVLWIGRVASRADLGQFRVAYYYIWSVQQLLGGLGRSVMPMLGFRLGKSGGDLASFRRDVWKVGAVSGLLFIVVTALFVLAAPLLIRVLYGAEYLESVPLVGLMAIGHLVIGFAVVIDPFYIYTRQLGLALRLNVILFVLLLGLGYGIIHGFGVRGGALYVSLAQFSVLVHLIVMVRWSLRHRAATDAEQTSVATEVESR